jgi:type VI secretion system protein ImpA
MNATLQDLQQSPLAQTLREELGSLLRPISPQEPAGPSLRYDSLYDRIRQARQTENDALPQGVWQREVQQADWPLVDHLTTDALERRSKDLQLALWRTEALLHLHGLPGFAGGCQLILGLHCDFPNSLHPAPVTPGDVLPLDIDDPGVEGRLNLIQWLNEKLSVQLKLLPITAPDQMTGVPSFTFADMEAARLLEQTAQRKTTSAPGENRLKLFEQSLALTPSSWLSERWTELQHTTEMVFLLDDILDTVYGDGNGGLLRVKEILEGMRTICASALPETDLGNMEPVLGAAAEAAHAEAAAAAIQAGAPAEMTPPDPNPLVAERFQLRSRAEAYRRLAEIADFLARLEPHSPVPYLLHRAIAWGGMSLEELLPELLSDQAAVKDVGNLLRLKGSARK